MNIILAPDSFKGSLSANQAAEAMAAGIHSSKVSAHPILLPVADGGEGTVESLVRSTKGTFSRMIVEDPLGRPVNALYGVLGDTETCVIEIAEASGLTLLNSKEKNPLLTSSYGTGQLIKAALDAGYRKFIIGLGGSATNDGGAGLLQALGMKFLDSSGQPLAKGGGSLHRLASIDATDFDRRIQESTFTIASDVNNPLIGPNGASAVFGPQKGASPDIVKRLDESLTHFANIVERTTKISMHEMEGAGAAGGAGGALLGFFPHQMRPGIEVVLDAVSFKEACKEADLVLTGEGKSDRQTLSGKTPLGVSKASQSTNTPVFLISGYVDQGSKQLLRPYFKEIHSLVDQTVSFEEAITQAATVLEMKTQHIIEQYMQSKKYS